MVPTPNTSGHEFVSYHSRVDVNEGTVTVGFSRDPDDERSLDSLLLQRGQDARDDVPCVEGVYVEIPIQRYAAYGGITAAFLRRDSFFLRFDETTAHKMGGLDQIFVRFNLSDAEFASIRDGLNFIFAGCSCFREDDRGTTG